MSTVTRGEMVMQVGMLIEAEGLGWAGLGWVGLGWAVVVVMVVVMVVVVVVVVMAVSVVEEVARDQLDGYKERSADGRWLRQSYQ